MKNREIKFRVWDKTEKEMSYPINNFFTLDQEGEICDHDGFPLDQTEYVIQQFTGLLDKNKKEIYEGDIISVSYEDNLPDEKMLIIWSNDGLWWAADLPLKNNNYGQELYMYPKCKIIGNIFETSHLLEK